MFPNPAVNVRRKDGQSAGFRRFEDSGLLGPRPRLGFEHRILECELKGARRGWIGEREPERHRVIRRLIVILA